MHLSTFALLICATAFTIFGATSRASAQSVADNALNERTQLEFCATYLPCAIAVGIMDGVAEGHSRWQKMQNFFSTFGRTPALSKAEFDAFVASQTPAWRLEQVAKCMRHRGDYMRDFCEDSYLTREELRQAQDKRQPKKEPFDAFSARQRQRSVWQEDSRISSGLRNSCESKIEIDQYACDRLIRELTMLKEEVLQLNRDAGFLKYLPPFELPLRAESAAQDSHQSVDGKWSRKGIPTAERDQMIDRCDAVRRQLFGTIDDSNLSEARTLLPFFRQQCADLDPTYRMLAQTAEDRLARASNTQSAADTKAGAGAAASDAAALPRRDSGAANTLFSDALARTQRGQAIQVSPDDLPPPSGSEQTAALGALAQGLLGAYAGRGGAFAPVAQGLTAGMAGGRVSTHPPVEQQASRQGPSGTSGSGSGGDACSTEVQRLDNEMQVGSSQIPANDNVRRLALIHSVSIKMSQAMQPCDPTKARQYQQSAESALKTCQQIANTPSLCNR